MSERRNELQKLKREAELLDTKINVLKKQILIMKNRRNIKILGTICNYSIPYVVSATIAISVLCFFEQGFPFIKDNVTKEKKYILDYQDKNNIYCEEFYQDSSSDFELQENKLIYYSSWNLVKEGVYQRQKITYKISEECNRDLLDAILNEDIYYIFNNIDDYTLETEVSTIVPINNEAQVQAFLNFYDKNDYIEVAESNLRNTIVTLSELIFTIAVGLIVQKNRKFNLKEKINDIIFDFNDEADKLYNLEISREKLAQKILSIQKRGR